MLFLKKYSLLFIGFFLLVASVISLACLSRDQEFYVLLAYGTSFLSFLLLLFLLVSKRIVINFYVLLILGLVIRISLFFELPNLSDDFFRFSWDGFVFLDGGGVFDNKPVDYEFNNNLIANFCEENLLKNNSSFFPNGMNSKDYYSVYPPVAQYIFIISSYLADYNLINNVFFIRLLLLFFELITVFSILKILAFYGLNRLNVLMYVLNPLVVVEIIGNLHFEGVALAFFLLSFYMLIRNKLGVGSIIYGLAICSKLIPLLFLPFIAVRLGFKKAFLFLSIVLVVCFGLFALFYPINFMGTFFKSIQLYFHSFEFNASIYYLLRWIGEQLTGFNQIKIIGSITPLLTITSLLFFVHKLRWKNNWMVVLKCSTWLLLIYYSLSSVVHPWYIIYLVCFSVLTGYVYPLVWSGVVFLSYMAYADPYSVVENGWYLGLEYLILIVALFFDLKKGGANPFFLKGDGLKLPV